MKTILKALLILALATYTLSCSVQRNSARNGTGRMVLKDTSAVKDSLEYDLLVFDSSFDFWLNSRSHSKSQYSNQYLQSQNIQYVSEWNKRYMTGDRRIASFIDYNPTTEYPFDLNYKLYMYFKYFEESHRIKLLPYRMR